MKKTLLLITTLFSVMISFGQVTSISENFNTACSSGPFVPLGWTLYNAVPGTEPDGAWDCTSSGKGGTPGVNCTGLFGTPLSYHLDTAYLITPQLELVGYTGDIYLNFDTKTTVYNLGAKLEVVLVYDTSTAQKVDSATTFFSSVMTPVFSPDDETDWVTHQVVLTPYKAVINPIYVAFRYTSEVGSNGSKWFLDNILTTTVPLTSGIASYTSKGRIRLSGCSKDGSIVVNSTVPEAGGYQLQVMDMTGRIIYEGAQQLASGKSSFSIPSLHVTPGMYILKMGNNKGYDIARVQAW
jgi:hypothetical protein